MKRNRMIAFFTVVFIAFGLVNYYIFIRGRQALEPMVPSRILFIYTVVFLLMALSYPVARIAGKHLHRKLNDGLAFIGGMWFAGMLYFFLAAALADLTGFVMKLLPGTSEIQVSGWQQIRLIVFVAVVILVIALIVFGWLNTRRIKTRKIEIPLNKSAGSLKSLHLAVASDIHLGHVIGRKFLKKLVNNINRLEPDLVLFPGDIVDEDLKPVIEKNLGKIFMDLNPRYGVFAVTGNHEYIGGAQLAVEHLSKFGIRYLRDETVKISESFYLCGREDVSIQTFAGKKRKPLKELIRDADLQLPLIVMDHQPVALSEAAENRVDFLLCGHTHHGQIWPLNAITSRVFKVSRGYARIGSTHVYVSSGAGTWGPRTRIGTRPEIISVKLIFT